MSSPASPILDIESQLELDILESEAAAQERLRILSSGDAFLREALQKAIDAEQLIPAELAKLQAVLEQERHPLKRAKLEHQMELVERQLRRFAQVGRLRLTYLNNLRTNADREEELLRCADGVQGTLHWFKYWAWSYDPRSNSPLKNTPFYPFDFQANAIEWLERIVFLTREPGLVEKTRDMGWTWLFICWGVKNWRFLEQFICILSSHKEKFVDDKRNQNTLFEKARYQVRMLPEWMKPEGFNWREHSTHMKLINPENGSMLNGEAPVEDLGRSGRATCALLDEHASYPFGGFPQWTSIIQTTPSPISLSTVKGKLTKQYELKADPNLSIPVCRTHWREHPWKTEKWRSTLTLEMTKEEIAQEIEIDYEASQPGKVFTNWDERFVLVPWHKFVRFYADRGLGHMFLKDSRFPLFDSHSPEGKGFRLADGTLNFRIPADWLWGRAQDRGDTEGHRRVTSWAASPRANYPLNDLRVIASVKYHTVAVALSHVVADIKQREREVFCSETFDNASLSINSHEAAGERITYLDDHGLSFAAWNTDYEIGLPTIKEYIEITDADKANPFHSELRGRTRLIILTDDDDSHLVYDHGASKYTLTLSKTEEMKMVRFEMSVYHYPEEERGKPLKKMRPETKDDDFIVTLRGFAAEPSMFPPVGALTHTEEVERRIAPELSAEALAAMLQENPERAQGKYLARKAEIARVERDMSKGKVYDEFAAYEEQIEREG